MPVNPEDPGDLRTWPRWPAFMPERGSHVTVRPADIWRQALPPERRRAARPRLRPPPTGTTSQTGIADWGIASPRAIIVT